MKSGSNEVINISIKTLSPVGIMDDNGDKHSIYTDAIKDGNEIIIIDTEKLADAIFDKQDIFEEYLGILRNWDHNKQEKYDIKKFMNKNHLNIQDFVLKRLKCGVHFENVTEINTCIKGRGIPYIPGSSLKGAIRTAVLFSKMDKDTQNYILDNLNEYDFGKTYIGQNVFQAGKEIFVQGKKIKTKYNNIQSDAFRNLMVRDTNMDSGIKSAVYKAECINLYKDKEEKDLELGMPILIECIEKDQILNSQIIIKDNKNHNIKFEFNIGELCNYINNFYEKVIDRERAEIGKIESDEKDILIGKYNELSEIIRKHKQDKTGFVMRAGKLKGLFSSTIDVDLDNKHLGKIAAKFKKNRGANQFPTSKWVVTDSGKIKETFGWIEVKVDE